MQTSLSSLLSVLAYLPLFISAQTTGGGGGGNCTAFDWNQQPGFIVNGTTQRISAASTCPTKQNETQACPISAAGDVQLMFRYQSNTSFRSIGYDAPSGYQNFLHNLVLNAVNSSLAGATWPESVIGVIDTVQALPPGTSGYLNFTSLVRCFEGNMTGCSGGDLPGSFPIQVCAPVSQPVRGANVPPILAGTYAVAEIPSSDVGRYSNNPFGNQARGGVDSIRSRISFVSLALGMVVCIVVSFA